MFLPPSTAQACEDPGAAACAALQRSMHAMRGGLP